MEKAEQNNLKQNDNNELQTQIIEKIVGNDKDILVKENNYKNLKVKDYYVENAEEEIENKKFFGSEEFHDNIRRGLSVIEDTNLNQKEVLRKGHKKFDELTESKFIKWISYHLEIDLPSEKIKDESLEVELNSLHLSKIPIFFKSYQSLCIYRAFKDDGTCAQISFSEKGNSWVICTKNESAFVKSKEEIKDINKGQAFLRAIAETWFEYISSLDINEADQLKKYLSDKTLLGELCGGVAKQYVKYGNKADIIFFSIVENNSNEICITPPNVEKIFKQFNLKYKPSQETIACQTYQQFYELYKQIIIEINKSSFLEKGEGEVLYICGRPKSNPENEIVIKMAKVKTIEYKLYKEGQKCISQLSFADDEDTKKLIQNCIATLKNLQKYSKIKLNKYYLASSIRLMEDKKIELTNENIMKFVKDTIGEEKMNIIKD